MAELILQWDDPRIGTLTSDGEYQWPSVNSAGNGYAVPNDNLRWLDIEPRKDGSRRFVVVSSDMLEDNIGILLRYEDLTDNERQLEESLDIAYPDLTEEETKPAETVEDEPEEKPKKSKAKSKK